MQTTRRQFLKRFFSLGAFGFLGSYPTVIERYTVLTNVYRIPVPNLAEAFSGLRIVHLTDLHYGFLMPLTMIERVVKRANALKPDLIACTGDFVHERKSAKEIDLVWPVLSGLKAPLGVYSVLGNHDHWADAKRSYYWLERSGQDLRHKAIRIEREGKHLWLAGAGDLWNDYRPLDRVLAGVPDSDCRVLLAHNPDTADKRCSKRIDLVISGHTHGGQVNIPFVGPPLLPVRNKEYTSGLKRSLRGNPVFISRGIGWTVYPVRLNCYPEIAVLELFPAPAPPSLSV